MGLFDELLSQPGVTATGGGYGYDPTQDEMEVRFTAEGTPYNARPGTPLHEGHTRANQPMFNTPNVEVPTEPSLLNYGYDQTVQPPQQVDVNPTQEYQDINLPIKDVVNPMDFYNRQGRADYIPQNIVDTNTVFGSPSLGSLPNPTQDAYAEEQWYNNEQAKQDASAMEALNKASAERDKQAQIEAQLQALLKAQGLDNRAEWDMRRADDQFANLDKQYDINNQVATDDFGNPLLNANEHGQTSYDINAIKQESLDNLMMQDREPVVTPPVVTPTDNKPNYPSHLTPYAIKMLEEQRKRNEMFQGIGDTASEYLGGVKDRAGQVYDLGADAVQGVQDIYKDFTKPDTRTHRQRMIDNQTNYVEPVKEFITDTIPEFAEGTVDAYNKYAPPINKAIYEGGKKLLNEPVNTLLDWNQTAGDAIIDVGKAMPGAYSRGVNNMVKFGKTVGNVAMGEEYFDENKNEMIVPSKPDYTYPMIGEGAEVMGSYVGGMGAGIKLAQKAPNLVKYFSAIGGGTTTTDPTEGNLSTWIQDTEYRNAVTEYLNSETDSEASSLEKLKAYGKNFLEEGLIGGPIDAAIVAWKSIKNNPELKSKILEEIGNFAEDFETQLGKFPGIETEQTLRKDAVPTGGRFQSEMGQPNMTQSEMAVANNTQKTTQTKEVDVNNLQGLLDSAVDTENRIALNEQKAVAKANAKAQQQAELDAKPQAEVDELGFYSKAEQALLDLKQEKNLPEDIITYLKKKGVTQGELEDTGLLEMLTKKKASGDRVTRDGLLDYIGENKTKLHEYQHYGASEDDMLDTMGDFELDDPSYVNADRGTQYEKNYTILDDQENYQYIIDDFFEDDDNGIRLVKELHELFPEKYPLTKSMEYDKLAEELRELGSPFLDKSHVKTRKPIVKARLQELADIKAEEFTVEWDAKLLDEIDEKGVDGLYSISESSRIQDVVDSLSREQYLDRPVYEWDLKGGYKATGNEDTGIVIKDPDGVYITTSTDYAGNQHPDPVFSINEANVAINEHSINHGYQSYSDGETMYSSYTQPGMADKSTYREIPIIGSLKGQGRFTGAHMNEDNVVAWLRTSDRVDADGNRVLFIEEVQSDWHQQGRKRGFNKTTAAQATEIKRKIKVIEDRHLPNAEIMGNTAQIDKLKDEMAQLRGQIADMDYNVPNAPLKNERWQDMAISRAMKIASDEGYDRVVFANAEQQLDSWNPNRYLNDKGKVRYEELYKNIYDRNIPSFINKYAKKHGTTTGKVDIDFGGTKKNLNYIQITSGLTASIAGGQALANDTKVTGGLLGTQEETQAEETKGGILNNVKSWKPNNNLTTFVKTMENDPLRVGNAKVKEYDDVGHKAKGYGTKSGLLAQDTEAEATNALNKKLVDANKAVDRLVKIDLNENQRNALVSLVYNVGATGFGKSNALKALNNGNIKTFLKEAFDPKVGFVKTKGKIVKGLVNRRAREKQIFTKGNYGN